MAGSPDRASRVGRVVEMTASAVVLALPLLYLLTYPSFNPKYFGRYSASLALAIAAGTTMAALWMLSYRWRLPRALAALRTRVVLLACTLLVSVFALELLLYATDPMPYRDLPNIGRHQFDPDLGHVYVPNHTQVLENPEWRQEWRSNSEGVRADRDYGPKREGVFRILVVGDSFTVGDQVAFADTYPAVLEQLLNERLPAGSVEVINAGVPSYGTVHMARYLDKFGRRFEPDLVVLGMTPNDLSENVNPLAVIARDGAMVPRDGGTDRNFQRWLDFQRWYSVHGYWQRSRLKRAIDRARLAFRGEAGYRYRRAFEREPDAITERQYALAEGYLRDASQTAKEMGAALVVLTIPFREQLQPMPEGLDPARFSEHWAAVAGEMGLVAIDAYAPFAAHPAPASLYWVEDGHCTAAGYRLIGETLADGLWAHRDAIGLEPPRAR